MKKGQVSHGLNTKGRNKDKKIKFWASYRKTNGQSAFKIEPALLQDYLVENKYRRLTSFGEIQTVHLINNIAYLKTKQEVFNDCLALVKQQESDELRNCFIKEGEAFLISKQAILGSLPEIELQQYRDQKNTVRLFYIDKIVIIKRNKIKVQSYSKFNKGSKYILSKKIIQRNYIKADNKIADFERFLSFATNDKEHLLSVVCTLGYLISSYKNPSIANAVIITDILSQVRNEAFGRSGKGLLIKALSYMIMVVEYNGKVTDLTNDKFVFQNVDIATALIVLQDVTKGFLFESLFSTLTDNMSIERKHRNKISIPFFQSPKVALTTNYTIPQDTDSFKDRKHLLTLNNFFNAQNKPEKHFKKLLFEWNVIEWARFDAFMIKCVQMFLKKGLVKYDNSDLKLQKLINITSKEFVELMESDYDELNTYWRLKKIAEMMQVGTKEVRSRSKIVSKWMEAYAAFKGYKIDKRESGGIVKIAFVNDS
ncbi:hypothetical protein [Maribacter aestuarii]|uniref:hypothetical protein n=1 Tax=Maribacter aestuarii TaxID=1130723 RepID=UPI00248D177C|nr:hypothetical protein [Maribacter aestuarii]